MNEQHHPGSMHPPVTYAITFSGKLRKGYTPEAVKQALSQRLKLSPERVERLFAEGPTVLKQTRSQEEAKRIVRQLAAVGAIATIRSGKPAPQPKRPDAEPKTAKPALPLSPPLPDYTPLKMKRLFKPLIYAVATIETLLVPVYAALIIGLLGWVVGGSLFGSWGSELLNHPLPGFALQSIVFIVGLVVLLIVAKPLLALKANPHRGIAISARQEPDLYAFVEDVCERIEAPMPSEIRLYNEAAVCTAYHRGPAGFFRNQSVLMIGVPLIAGLNSSQLAAQIALALNRYRSAMAPRATTVLLAINQWLQRAAYGDDPLETALKRWHAAGRIGGKLFGLIDKLFSAANALVSRRMQFSRAIGRRLIHSSVAEGDRLALGFTDTAGLDRLLAQNSLLPFVSESLLPGLKAQWQEKSELPDNLVQMIVLRSHRLPADTPAKLRLRQARDKALIGDIVPSDTQRIEHAATQALEKPHECRSPAASLFRSFPKLAHTMTLRFYHHRLRLPVSSFQLKKLSPKGSPEQKLQQQLDHYFHRLYTDFLPLKLRQYMHNLTNANDARKQWRMAMERLSPEYKQGMGAHAAFKKSEAAMLNSSSAEQMQLAGLGTQWGLGKLKGDELEAVHQQARDDEAEYGQTGKRLEEYLKAYTMRLGGTLAILDLYSSLPASLMAFKKEASRLVSLLERIDNVNPQLRELKRTTILLETLLNFSTGRRHQKLQERTEELAAESKDLVTSIGIALKSAPYPFADGGKPQKLMRYALQDALEEKTPLGDFDRGNDTVNRIAQVQRRIVARLTVIGGLIEKRLGFKV